MFVNIPCKIFKFQTNAINTKFIYKLRVSLFIISYHIYVNAYDLQYVVTVMQPSQPVSGVKTILF